MSGKNESKASEGSAQTRSGILRFACDEHVGGLALGAALSNMKSISDASSTGERIMEVINRVPIIDSDNVQGETLESVSGEVEFDQIEFAYPSRPDIVVLSDFSIKIPAGKTVALVGGSGRQNGGHIDFGFQLSDIAVTVLGET